MSCALPEFLWSERKIFIGRESRVVRHVHSLTDLYHSFLIRLSSLAVQEHILLEFHQLPKPSLPAFESVSRRKETPENTKDYHHEECLFHKSLLILSGDIVIC